MNSIASRVVGHNTEYRLDSATIEADLSEVEVVDESMEDMRIRASGISYLR
jgi:hypothetical protein